MGLMAAIVVTLGLGACGTGGEPTTPGNGGPTTASTTPTEQDETEGSQELPGERTEIYPYEGDELAVRGVTVDDTLNLRNGPGIEFEVAAELAPLADGMIASGHNRTLDDGTLWVEMDADGVIGWASAAHLAQLGQISDITSELPELPSGDDVVELAQAVARERAAVDEGGPEPMITVVDGPHSGDLTDMTVDLTGLADDAVTGERLHVFATIEGDRFTVRTVEATVLCTRGVNDAGLCL